MKRWILERFSRKLTAAFVSLLVAAMGVSALIVTSVLKERMTDELLDRLQAQARLIGAQLPAGALAAAAADPHALNALAHRLGGACGCRVTFIRPDGRVFGDSSVEDAKLGGLENHLNRPEIQEALQGREGHSIRRSSTVGDDLLYAAAPLPSSAGETGVVRVAMPLTQVRGRIERIRRAIAWGGGALLIVAVAAALWLAGSISRPVSEMSGVARRLAQKDYAARVRAFPSDELGTLGRSLNFLAERIAATVLELSSEKAQLEAMLSGMVEGVLAVDADGRVIMTNAALERLFSLETRTAIGRPLTDAIRQNQLIGILQTVLKELKPRVDEIQLFSPEERVLESHAVPLMDGTECRGAMLVLHDVTPLRRLERMRREFVANVSHELRTPVASIRGFAETLRDGAKDDPEHRDDFIGSIVAESEHMGRLVDDLLDLAAIESGRRAPSKSEVALEELAAEALEQLKPIAKKRGVTLVLETSAGARVQADRGQLRQVFTNLLDNAVKFNRDGGRVAVRVSKESGSARVTIEDTGLGIPEADLPRIFERFYRVDKARTRELGGTGLGLSIVKHIVEAHGGEVSASSVEGRGSTVSFTLPA
ncbi:MAG: PAS domain-containing protein [Proteobacteria bacterium]|nr:PAS domain-containing protein [Pseudomonadota bacterium]